MKQLIDLISEEVKEAFNKAGYNPDYGKTNLSNRPDLCEFQCNGAMAAAKEYHKAPIAIAEDVVSHLEGNAMFSEVEALKPGFLNFRIAEEFLGEYVEGMLTDERFGLEKTNKPLTIMIDYGGPNVAKPLHVGHLRSAVIGESVKRISRFMGHNVIGDVHLGDWGLQMGLIITELKLRKPELVYFDESYDGDYPDDAPFTLAELEEIYPTASGKSKEDDDYKEAALQATKELQAGRRGYRALLNHILTISVTDLKKNYEKLNVSFDLWKGESDAQEYIADMVQGMKDKGLAYESEGALVVDVKEDTDKKEVPPCMILKSDGASLYTTTDLATLVWRVNDYNPDRIIYVVDNRQEMHFVQVFRCAKKAGIVKEDTSLEFLGFGTMNGLDGKPFKTRDGGVMRLEYLLNDTNEKMYSKITDNNNMTDDEAKEVASIVSLAAIKYGDLSNQASKDYIFDIDKFTSSEGNTGPYILYTIVRIKSILNKYLEGLTIKSILNKYAKEPLYDLPDELHINAPDNESSKKLMLELVKFQNAILSAYDESAPHKICAFLYDVCNAFNHFYHETKILSCEDEDKKKGYIALLYLTKSVLECCIDLLGFYAPDKM